MSSRQVAFQAKVKQAGEVLSAAELFGQARIPPPSYTGLGHQVRKLTYREEWDYISSKELFDFKLVDGSIFQFQDRPESHTEVSFSFYQSPLDADDFETFVRRTYDASLDQMEDCILELQDQYEEYLSSASLRKATTIFRYDHSPGLYKEGVHPASHIHVGLGNEIRIGTERIMNPVSFALFVVRQTYPEQWIRLHGWSDMHDYVKNVRKSLQKVGAAYRQPKDEWEVELK